SIWRSMRSTRCPKVAFWLFAPLIQMALLAWKLPIAARAFRLKHSRGYLSLFSRPRVRALAWGSPLCGAFARRTAAILAPRTHPAAAPDFLFTYRTQIAISNARTWLHDHADNQSTSGPRDGGR